MRNNKKTKTYKLNAYCSLFLYKWFLGKNYRIGGKGMKNKSIILSLLIACIFMHGCAVKSEATLLSEAKREYGDCEMVSYETSDKSVTIQLSDNEYGFKYDVSSSMDSIDIDGSCFGYLEGTHSNFSYKYMDNFSDLHKQEVYEIADEYKEYDLEFDDTFVDTTVLATIYCADEDKNIEAALRIGKIYHDYDTRGFWKKGLICCENYDPTTGAVSIGNVHIDDCKFYIITVISTISPFLWVTSKASIPT